MDPTPKRRILKEKTPEVLARSHPKSRARGAKKTLKENWVPQETMRIRKPARTISQPEENMGKRPLPVFGTIFAERRRSFPAPPGNYSTIG
jgi:hypothetical protein